MYAVSVRAIRLAGSAERDITVGSRCGLRAIADDKEADEYSSEDVP
jgi:hypothetical protein